MSSDVFGRIEHYYDDLLSKHGHTPRACDYGRPESQQAKFEVMAAVADYASKSVLDVGCGLADYAAFLSARFEDVRYVGVDITQAMVERAQRLRPQLDLRCVNILEQDPGRFDIVTANGIFYLLGAE